MTYIPKNFQILKLLKLIVWQGDKTQTLTCLYRPTTKGKWPPNVHLWLSGHAGHVTRPGNSMLTPWLCPVFPWTFSRCLLTATPWDFLWARDLFTSSLFPIHLAPYPTSRLPHRVLVREQFTLTQNLQDFLNTNPTALPWNSDLVGQGLIAKYTINDLTKDVMILSQKTHTHTNENATSPPKWLFP